MERLFGKRAKSPDVPSDSKKTENHSPQNVKATIAGTESTKIPRNSNVSDDTIANIEKAIHKDYERKLEALSTCLYDLSKENQDIREANSQILANLKEKEDIIRSLTSKIEEHDSQTKDFQRQLEAMSSLLEESIKENEVLQEQNTFHFVSNEVDEKFPQTEEAKSNATPQEEENEDIPLEDDEPKDATTEHPELLEEASPEVESSVDVGNQVESEIPEKENPILKEESEEDQSTEMTIDEEMELMKQKYTLHPDICHFLDRLKMQSEDTKDELYKVQQEHIASLKSIDKYEKKLSKVVEHYKNCLSKEKNGRVVAERLVNVYKKKVIELQFILQEMGSSDSDDASELDSNEE